MPITASVGSGGKNLTADSAYVQVLLSYWEKNNDRYPIKVDGIVGPKTIGAIQEFQRAKTGWVDGRVDPGGRCLRALEAEFAGLQREVKAYAVLAMALSIQFPIAVEGYDPTSEPPRFQFGFVERFFAEAVAGLE